MHHTPLTPAKAGVQGSYSRPVYRGPWIPAFRLRASAFALRATAGGLKPADLAPPEAKPLRLREGESSRSERRLGRGNEPRRLRRPARLCHAVLA